MMRDVASVRASWGTEPHVSDWLTVDQELMNQFGAATLDPDWMHLDPVRAAAEGPYEGTIAFGFSCSPFACSRGRTPYQSLRS